MQVSLSAWRTPGWMTLYLGLSLALSACASKSSPDFDASPSTPEAKQEVAVEPVMKPVDTGEAQGRSTTVNSSFGPQDVASDQAPEDLDERGDDLEETGASDLNRRSKRREEVGSLQPKRSSKVRSLGRQKAKKRLGLRDDDAESEDEPADSPAPPAPPAPPALADSAQMPKTTLGGAQEPSLYRAQLKSGYLPERVEEAEQVEALKRVDLSARPLSPLPSGGCLPLEKIKEILSFSILERLDHWGVNASLTGFAQDSEERLKSRLPPSKPQLSHLKVSLGGRGLGEHCVREGRLNIRGVIELKTAQGGRIFVGGAAVTYKDPARELSTPKRQARHVRRLVEEWRDQLAVALKPCLISASQMKQKQRLRLRLHKREIDEETLASCLVEQ